MDVAEQTLLQDDVNGRGALTQGFGSLLGAADQTLGAGIHGGGHNAAQALVNADGRAGNDGILNGIHLVGDHVNGMVDAILSKQFGKIRAGGHCFAQNHLAYFSGNHVTMLLWLLLPLQKLRLFYHVFVAIATVFSPKTVRI